MRYLALPGRALFALLFILSGFDNFSPHAAAYAAHQGVPMAHMVVPLAGVLALAGGLSVLLGFHARLGAVLLIAFLVPVTLMMHNFWAVHDPAMRQMQMINFLKNTSLLGGAILISYFGAGPLSLDARLRAPRWRRFWTPRTV
jgi:putative oxidoreductase